MVNAKAKGILPFVESVCVNSGESLLLRQRRVGYPPERESRNSRTLRRFRHARDANGRVGSAAEDQEVVGGRVVIASQLQPDDCRDGALVTGQSCQQSPLARSQVSAPMSRAQMTRVRGLLTCSSCSFQTLTWPVASPETR